MKRLIGFLFVLTLAVNAFGIKIGEYTLSFDDTSNNFYSYRIGYKLRLDSIRIHGELNRMNLNALRYFALWGDVKGIDLSDCVIQGDSLPEDAFVSGYANGAKPRRESASIDDYDNSDHGYGFRANFRYISLPRNLRYIGNAAFYGACLVSIEIPTTVTEIHNPFTECIFLKSIKVGYKSLDGLDKIDRYAFSGIPENVTLLVPKGTKAMYEADERFSYFTAIEEYDEDTNGISTVAPAISKTQADKFYTLDGRYAGTDFSSLPKGTYVVGGKKVMK